MMRAVQEGVHQVGEANVPKQVLIITTTTSKFLDPHV